MDVHGVSTSKLTWLLSFAAENMIREVDRDVDGWLAMARMHIAAIAALGGENAASGDRDLNKAMFERAVAHRENAYPMPHTQ